MWLSRSILLLVCLLPSGGAPAQELAFPPDVFNTPAHRGHCVDISKTPYLCNTITSTLRDTGTAATETACWWPVAFELGGQMGAKVIPLPGEPIFRYVLWSYSAPASDLACHIEHDKVSLDLDLPFEGKPNFEIGFFSGEIVVSKPGCLYRLTALDPRPNAGQPYSHGGSPAILYCDQRAGFCEAELSGPLARLQPGEETTFTFAIGLEIPPGDGK